jgi:hypothetical protein
VVDMCLRWTALIIWGKVLRLSSCNTVGLSNRNSTLVSPFQIICAPFSVGEHSCVANDFKALMLPTRSDFKSLQQ